MVNVLEGTSVELASRAADIYSGAVAVAGHRLHYLRSHGSLDIKHIAFYEGLMNRLDKDEDRERQ